MTLRLGYLPSPNPSCRLPSLAAAMAQIFSVHDRSLVATTAKVSVIWWHRPSSAGTRGPMGLVTGPARPGLVTACPSTVPSSICSSVGRCMIMSSGSSGMSISPNSTWRRATLLITMAWRSAAYMV